MDTCLSIFTNYFPGNLDFSHDLEDIAFVYRHYLSLMGHWRKVLPNKIMDVSYEEMVANQEKVSRELIAHIGLEWDDACLDFTRNR